MCLPVFVLDWYWHHVLTCKRHTGNVASHDHVMNVSAQLARNSGLQVRVNCKVATAAADNNKQGDVQAMEFGIPGYDDLEWYMSFVCDRIGSSMQHDFNGKLQLGNYLNAPARIKIRRYRRDYVVKNIAFAPVILSVPGKIHLEFLRLLWVMADMQTVGARWRDARAEAAARHQGRTKWGKKQIFLQFSGVYPISRQFFGMFICNKRDKP